MRQRHASRSTQLRSHIAQEAARLMVEGGIRDYALAKRKAAEHLQVSDAGHLPRNEEIEHAVLEYQRLFRSDHHWNHLGELRKAAVKAMRFLALFQPCLVGPVLRGTADQHSGVILHLFAEPSEEVGLFLREHGIPYELGERRLRFSPDDIRPYPAFSFMAGEVPIELVVFPHHARRQSPLSPVDGKPMRRAGLAAVTALTGNSC